MTGFVCEHIICLLNKKGMLNGDSPIWRRLSSNIWHSSTFLKCFPKESAILIPGDVSKLVRDCSIGPNLESKQLRRGRPKQNLRIKKYQQGGANITKSMSKKQYKALRSNYDTSLPAVSSSSSDYSSLSDSDYLSGSNSDYLSGPNSDYLSDKN
jgi:hypothetical protein